MSCFGVRNLGAQNIPNVQQQLIGLLSVNYGFDFDGLTCGGCRYEWRNQNYRRSGLPRGASLLGALNSLLNFYVRTGDLDEALEVYRGMRRHGPKPEAITYNTLMSAFANTGGVKKSLELLAEMQEDGLQPTVRTYGTLLNACAKGLEVS